MTKGKKAEHNKEKALSFERAEGLGFVGFVLQILNQIVYAAGRRLDVSRIFVAGGNSQTDVFNDDVDDFEFVAGLFDAPDDFGRFALIHRHQRIYENLVGRIGR